jgi:hypothetical protein
MMQRLKARRNAGTVERENAGLDAGLGTMENLEVLLVNADRYIDPLVRDKVHDLSIARHRDRTANEDAMGKLITWEFATKAWSEAPRFVIGEGMEMQEVMPELRQFLVDIGFQRMAIGITRDLVVHGWAATRFQFDEEGNLDYFAFSETLVRAQDIERWRRHEVMENGLPLTWVGRPKLYRVHARHDLPVPCGRAAYGVESIDTTLDPLRDPWFLVAHRGDPTRSQWFGYSRLEAGWDAIIKLREESHANAFRKRVFPIATVPPYWTKAQMSTFFENISRWDSSNALAVRAGKDDTGKLYPDLPAFQWVTPGGDAAGASQDSGGVRGLSSEYVRFCALYGITVKELAGDPGGAQEAGATDLAQAWENNIREWNYTCSPFVRQFVERLVMLGIIPECPPGFRIVGVWEWQKAQNEILAVQQQQADVMATEAQAYDRENAPPRGLMAPITSSWVKGYGHGPSTGMAHGSQPGADSLYLQFHGSGQTFEYPMGGASEQMATDIETSGSPGGWVHDELGVPARTPYQPHSRIPSQMAYWFGAAQTHAIAEQGRQAKVSQFGTFRPAGPEQPLRRWEQTVRGMGYQRDPYPLMTQARSEQTWGGTGPLSGIPTRTGPAAPPGTISPGSPFQPGWMGQPTPAAPAPTAPPASTPAPATPAATPIPAAAPAAVQTTGVSGDTGSGVDYGYQPTITKKLTPTKKSAGVDQGIEATTDYEKLRGRPPKGAVGHRTARRRPTSFGQTPQFNPTRPTLSARVNAASLGDLSLNQMIEHARNVTGQGISKSVAEKIRQMHEALAATPFYRENYVAVGNSMSFRDHPYIYHENGKLSVEYPCVHDWRQNVVGQVGELKINVEDPALHGSTTVGTITWGWDEENDAPNDVLEYDRENVMALLEAAGSTNNEVYRRLKAGQDPDVSTEYHCRIQRHNGRNYQRDFKAQGACLVTVGNCPTGACDFRENGEHDEYNDDDDTDNNEM